MPFAQKTLLNLSLPLTDIWLFPRSTYAGRPARAVAGIRPSNAAQMNATTEDAVTPLLHRAPMILNAVPDFCAMVSFAKTVRDSLNVVTPSIIAAVNFLAWTATASTAVATSTTVVGLMTQTVAMAWNVTLGSVPCVDRMEATAVRWETRNAATD